MWDPTPWVVTDADISPEMARLVAYTASGGAEGIIEPPDLRVRALSTPGNRVRVAPGGALLKNRYAGGGQQTYALRNATQHNSPIITATGSSGGRTDLVVARVLDPNYEGSAPSDPNDFQYARTEIIEGVPSNTRSVLDLNLNFPAIALARINIPSSTATITNSMITDLRRVAVPRKERYLFAWTPPADERDYTLTNENRPEGQAFPSFVRDGGDYPWWVDIPEWATRVQLLGHWSGVRVGPVAGRWGRIFVRIGHHSESSNYTNHIDGFRIDWNLDDVGGGVQREFWSAGDEQPVPEDMRGTRQPVILRGYVGSAGSGGASGSGPLLNRWSSVSADVEFSEGPA